jgi:hypothetical protein
MHGTSWLPSSLLAVALGAPAGAHSPCSMCFQAALLGNVKDPATKEALCCGSTS